MSGCFARQLNLPQVPTKQAQLRGYQILFGQEPATIVNIGSHGFSVLEVRGTYTEGGAVGTLADIMFILRIESQWMSV